MKKPRVNSGESESSPLSKSQSMRSISASQTKGTEIEDAPSLIISPDSDTSHISDSTPRPHIDPLKSNCCIFWDFENTPPPMGVPGHVVVQHLRKKFQRYGPIVMFRAYVEITDTLKKSMRSELQASGVSVVDVPHNSRKDAADKMLLVDMIAYAIDHPPPANIILISGDRDFCYGLSVLRNRLYNVILVMPNKVVSPTLSSQANELLEWRQDIIPFEILAQYQKDRGEVLHRIHSTSSMAQLHHSASHESVVSLPGHTNPKVSLLKGHEFALELSGSRQPGQSPNRKQEANKNKGSTFEPSGDIALPTTYFDVLTGLLEASKHNGVSKPLKNKVKVDLLAKIPNLCENLRIDSVEEFLQAAAESGLIRIGGNSDQSWISMNDGFVTSFE